MKNLLPKKSKKGITLVETVIAVVVLAILTTGILSLMTAGGRKILLMSKEASDQAAAVQQLDLAISAISNGSDEYILKDTTTDVTYCHLDTDALKSAIKLEDVTITAECSLYNIADPQDTVDDNGYIDYKLLDIRGWYLTLTYTGQSGKTVTVTGFASNSEGVFDKE